MIILRKIDTTTSGISNHSELNELSYVESGHTGFSQNTHLHDDRYYKVNFETFTLSGTDISNKYIDLQIAPKTNNSLNLFVDGGLKGLFGTDYTVSGTRINWGLKGWDGVLDTGDVISTVCWY